LGIAEVGRWSVATQPGLVGVLLVVNALTAFSLTRVFLILWSNQTDDSAIAEAHWPMAANDNFDGLHLHAPLVLQQFNLLPDQPE